MLRRAATEEPALLAPLGSPSSARAWQLARTGVADLLVAGRASASQADVDLVLRWLASQLLWPVAGEGSAMALVRGLTPGDAPAPVVPQLDHAELSPSLGWPTA